MPMATAEILETPGQVDALASRDPSELAAGDAVDAEHGALITATCLTSPRGQWACCDRSAAH
jgi:hypothetical protein